MKGDREFLFNFFSELDKQIGEKYKDIKLNACIIGGAFFVLHSLRENSPDIDIIVQDNTSYQILNNIGVKLAKKHKITLDLLFGTEIANKNLPKNYMRFSKPLKRERSKRKHLKLWTLSPYLVLLTKIGRYSEKDKRDINLIMSSGKFSIKKKRFFKMLKEFDVKAIQKVFDKNLKEFLEKYEEKLVLSWWEKLGLPKPIKELEKEYK